MAYVEINHSQAFARFKKGQDVTLCPSNLRPGHPWHPEITINKNSCEREYSSIEETWEKYKMYFKSYNCSKETGLKIKYYIPTTR